jgi:hypothetical protein
MKVKTTISILTLLLCATGLNAKAHEQKQNYMQPKLQGRPEAEFKLINVGRLWSSVGNFGNYEGYEWPGGKGVSYLWQGYLWIGAMVSESTFVSYSDYSGADFAPSEDGDWIIKKPGISTYDIECKYDDWLGGWSCNMIGLKVIQRAMAWPVEGYNDFVIYEYKITYDADKSFHHSDALREVYVAWEFDADCGMGISSDPNLDDLVYYDGWVANEWTTAYRPYNHSYGPYPYDEVTLYDDGTIDSMSDGVLDQFTVFGDALSEHTLSGDTLYLWRNISYMYDGDHSTRVEDDEAEFGMAPAYIGVTVLYAPPSNNDSVWTDEYGGTCRMIRPYSHQWWNWSNDPPRDDRYPYMVGKHPFSREHRFMPHPFDWSTPEFDYRFLHTYGPYEMADGDTLEFVVAGLAGFGLNGGYGYGKGADEGIFEKDKWYPGARWVADQALKAYYLGSQISDPLHPSSPSEDIHWAIAAPPEVPALQYSADQGVVTLAWTDIAERTPDPVDGTCDFAGYNIYRSEFKIGRWELIKGFVDSVFAGEHLDDFSPNIYEYIREGEAFPHSHIDSNIIYGIPYFYAVTAFDKGRKSPPASIPLPSVESRKINYKQNGAGEEIPITVKTKGQVGLDKVTIAPNPYLGSARWERESENRIQFMNLPGSCRIRIYTVSGDLIKEIEHTDGTGDEYWDLHSAGEDIASGLYVYKVEALIDGKTMHRIGKFVVVR